MKKTIYFALMSLALGSLPAFAEVDCVKLSVAVKHAIAAERTSVLEVVAQQIAANPSCACDVVKAAIEGSNADAATVAAIVEAAVIAAPDQMRLVSQCAVAVAPDALVGVQAVLAKLDPNTGDGATSSKGGKANIVSQDAVASNNPLDFPVGSTANGSGAGNNTTGGGGGNPVGPRPGDSPLPFLPPGTDPGTPPVVNTPENEVPETTDTEFFSEF